MERAGVLNGFFASVFLGVICPQTFKVPKPPDCLREWTMTHIRGTWRRDHLRKSDMHMSRDASKVAEGADLCHCTFAVNHLWEGKHPDVCKQANVKPGVERRRAQGTIGLSASQESLGKFPREFLWRPCPSTWRTRRWLGMASLEFLRANVLVYYASFL